ncbi:MAG TPA: hypothetical protein VF454_01750 [Gemmatimonadales bacterium]
MPFTIIHPRDPRTVLRLDHALFRPWRLQVGGRPVEPGPDGAHRITLTDGSASQVRIEGGALESHPVLIIDDARLPTAVPIGASGILAALLPVTGMLAGFPGMIIGLISCVLVLLVARTHRAPIARFAAGLAGMMTAWVVGIGVYIFGGYARALAPPPPQLQAAQDALARLPEVVTRDPVPVGTGPVAPLTVAEVLQLRRAVAGGDFATAESLLVALGREAHGDVRRETRWRNAYRMTFQAQGDSFAHMLDRWVAAMPEAAEPVLARAWHHYWMAYRWRGEGSTAMVSNASLQRFGVALRDAARDATTALQRDPGLLPGYWVLLNVARTEEDRRSALTILDHALAVSPTSFESYAHAMIAYYPEWGGTPSQLEAFADEAALGADRNPELKKFAYFARWKFAQLRVERSDEEVIAEARAVAEAASDTRFLETYGHALWHGGYPDAAAPWLDSALVLDPLYTDAIETRMKLYNQLARAVGPARDSLLKRRHDDQVLLSTLRPMMIPNPDSP